MGYSTTVNTKRKVNEENVDVETCLFILNHYFLFYFSMLLFHRQDTDSLVFICSNRPCLISSLLFHNKWSRRGCRWKRLFCGSECSTIIFFFSLIIFPQFLISQRRIQRTNTEHPQSEIELFLCEKTAQNLHLIKLQKKQQQNVQWPEWITNDYQPSSARINAAKIEFIK